MLHLFQQIWLYVSSFQFVRQNHIAFVTFQNTLTDVNTMISLSLAKRGLGRQESRYGTVLPPCGMDSAESSLCITGGTNPPRAGPAYGANAARTGRGATGAAHGTEGQHGAHSAYGALPDSRAYWLQHSPVWTCPRASVQDWSDMCCLQCPWHQGQPAHQSSPSHIVSLRPTSWICPRSCMLDTRPLVLMPGFQKVSVKCNV